MPQFKSNGVVLNNECGWVIQIASLFPCDAQTKIFFKPQALPTAFQENGLNVEIIHTTFSDGIGTCVTDEDLIYGHTSAELISIVKI